MSDGEVLKGLANNGPWAAMAGFLLWTVLKTWASDRSQVTSLLTSFRESLEALKTAVEKLTERLEEKP